MTRRGLLGFLSGAGASAVIPAAKAVAKKSEVKFGTLEIKLEIPEPEEYFVSQAFGKVPIPKGTITDIHRDIKRICEEARKADADIDVRNAKIKADRDRYWKEPNRNKTNDATEYSKRYCTESQESIIKSWEINND